MKTLWYFVLIAFLLLSGSVMAQVNIEGKVSEKATGQAIPGAHIRLGKWVAVTNAEGYYNLNDVKPGIYEFVVTAIGFENHQTELKVSEAGPKMLNHVALIEKTLGLNEVVVTATRTENKISDIPGRIELISPEKLQLTASHSVDEVLALLPGVTVSRSFVLFSHTSTVSMRGMGGNEQARTLVLVDGVPVSGTGAYYYKDALNVGLVTTEDMVVMMDEMGIETNLDIDRVLETGKMVERIVGRKLRSESINQGRIPKNLSGRA